eukprot:4124995-Pleurochrysis_carterae.AAC.1
MTESSCHIVDSDVGFESASITFLVCPHDTAKLRINYGFSWGLLTVHAELSDKHANRFCALHVGV